MIGKTTTTPAAAAAIEAKIKQIQSLKVARLRSLWRIKFGKEVTARKRARILAFYICHTEHRLAGCTTLGKLSSNWYTLAEQLLARAQLVLVRG